MKTRKKKIERRKNFAVRFRRFDPAEKGVNIAESRDSSIGVLISENDCAGTGRVTSFVLLAAGRH